MIDALKVIIAKSPQAAQLAVQAIKALNNESPAMVTRYLNVVDVALGDSAATFTAKEQELIASYIEGEKPSKKSRVIHIRVTDSEYLDLELAADGKAIASYTRQLWGF